MRSKLKMRVQRDAQFKGNWQVIIGRGPGRGVFCISKNNLTSRAPAIGSRIYSFKFFRLVIAEGGFETRKEERKEEKPFHFAEIPHNIYTTYILL